MMGVCWRKGVESGGIFLRNLAWCVFTSGSLGKVVANGASIALVSIGVVHELGLSKLPPVSIFNLLANNASIAIGKGLRQLTRELQRYGDSRGRRVYIRSSSEPRIYKFLPTYIQILFQITGNLPHKTGPSQLLHTRTSQSKMQVFVKTCMIPPSTPS